MNIYPKTNKKIYTKMNMKISPKMNMNIYHKMNINIYTKMNMKIYPNMNIYPKMNMNIYPKMNMNIYPKMNMKIYPKMNMKNLPYNETILQEQLRLLMDGRPYEEQHDFCDFSLADQYEAVAAKGVAPAAPVDFEPRVQKSIVYIVAAVIFNENGEVSFSCYFIESVILKA